MRPQSLFAPPSATSSSSVYDTGSALYDSFELRDVSRRIDMAIITAAASTQASSSSDGLRSFSMPHLSAHSGTSDVHSCRHSSAQFETLAAIRDTDRHSSYSVSCRFSSYVGDDAVFADVRGGEEERRGKAKEGDNEIVKAERRFDDVRSTGEEKKRGNPLPRALRRLLSLFLQQKPPPKQPEKRRSSKRRSVCKDFDVATAYKHVKMHNDNDNNASVRKTASERFTSLPRSIR